jgi:hypothetical protein
MKMGQGSSKRRSTPQHEPEPAQVSWLIVELDYYVVIKSG